MPGGETGNSKVRGTDSPLAFTPTAVMKKIAADRRDSDPAGGKIPVPELKISQSAENGDMFSIVPPGGGMLPLPSLSAQQQQQQAQAMLQQQQQQQQRLRLHAMQQQMAALQQATSPTGLIEQQQRFMMLQQQHQMQQQQQQQHYGHQQQQQHQHFGHQQGYQGRNMQQHHPQQVVGLSRFFSPEVLAQAQSGNGPAMPPLPTQKAQTLEEIERQAAAVRI